MIPQEWTIQGKEEVPNKWTGVFNRELISLYTADLLRVTHMPASVCATNLRQGDSVKQRVPHLTTEKLLEHRFLPPGGRRAPRTPWPLAL